jgi:hypothetical protein
MLSFGQALSQVERMGYLKNVCQIDAKAYVATEAPYSWQAAARALAGELPGMVRCSIGRGGLSWINGNTKDDPAPQGVVLTPSDVTAVEISRAVVSSLYTQTQAKSLWTVGACARDILRWVAVPQPYEPTAERIMAGIPYGFHNCVPGRYERLVQYDVKAYYYTTLQRLPSIRCTVGPSGLSFQRLQADEQARWKDALTAVGETKPLRNTIAGVMAGSLRPGIAFTSAEPRKIRGQWPKGYDPDGVHKVRRVTPPGQPGPFRPAGLLLVHIGYVLCRKECLTSGGIYGTIDSVTTEGAAPTVFNRYGYDVEIACDGPADICHRGCYQIGKKKTLWYAMGHRDTIPVPVPPAPPVDYAEKVLHAWA